jgi:hypothetical protein
MHHKILPFLAFALAFWASCTPEPKEIIVEGWKPIYLPTSDMNDIRGMDSISLDEVGKIYTKGNLVYVGKPGWGVHVLDNTNHAMRNIAFIQIPGCNDIAIKGDVLFADNMKDLVTIRLNSLNPKQISVLNRSQNVFETPQNRNIPPVASTYFECVEASKGLVGGWTRATLTNPTCRVNGDVR